MASFVKLEWLDPYRLFASRLRLHHHAMEVAYNNAFAAFHTCHELLKEDLWSQFSGSPMEWFMAMATGEGGDAFVRPEPVRDYHYEAQAQDALADHQASAVLLFADDTLQTFGRGVLGKNHKSFAAYGPRYPDAKNPAESVAFTTLLRAATNAVRHVSEWDTPDLEFPYAPVPHCDRGCQTCRASQTIDVIQRAFGIGIHERVRDVVSMRVLIRVDGQLGTAEPEYGRFEAAMLSAAFDMAAKAGGDALSRLEAALSVHA